MLKDFSIKSKLMLSSTVSVFGLLILAFMLNSSLGNLSELDEGKTKIEELKSNMLMLRRNEKDFILRKDLKYKKKFERNVQVLSENINSLENILLDFDIDNSRLKEFDGVIKEYKVKFFSLTSKQVEIGLNHKSGLYGSLRRSVHSIQDVAKKSHDFKLLASVYDLRKQEKDFMLRRDLKYVNKFEKKIKKLSNSLNDGSILSFLKSYERDFLSLVKAEKEIGLTSKEGIQGSMRKTIHMSEELIVKLYLELDEKIASSIEFMKIKVYVIALVIISFVMIFAYILARDINQSIKKFQSGLLGFFKYLNNETSEVVMLKSDGQDEISLMSKVVNENIIKTRTFIDAEHKFLNEVSFMVEEISKGYLYKRFENPVESENLEKLRHDFNKMLSMLQENIAGSTNKILDVLVSFGELNFTNTIRNDDGKIAVALNEVAKLITQMLVDNKSNGLTLQKSSHTLLNNVDILNQNSNETATALEQTAASLEQMTGNIRSSTSSVEKMAEYANELNSSSSKGQNLASKTATSMDEINEQVMAINDSIVVIDQIAFQTNILSLNAAVEAATAGESGKGFAVVAGEVRNLASRSSEAAKEIKDLVENASSKAHDGKVISDDMIKGYEVLSSNIGNTLELINEVKNSSKEQLMGIEQINDAVTQLDRQTQDNVNIANLTQDIARQTDEIATLIVQNADDKEFIGKDEVKPKAF